MGKRNKKALEVQKWFLDSVTFEEEPYVIDYEQAAAVVDESLNTIVVARAGSGKTRTLIAKIVYLVVQRGVKMEEIMVFVFNANAAKEINERLMKMRVDGKPIIENVKDSDVLRVANTFHAFSRYVVFDVCGKRGKHKRILAEEKGRFLSVVVREMAMEKGWREKMAFFIRGAKCEDEKEFKLNEEELSGLSKMMESFVNRAQQRYLGDEKSLGWHIRKYLGAYEVDERSRWFSELGAECYKRYHRYLLSEKMDKVFAMKMQEMELVKYGTDFNLIVSWASQLIMDGGREIEQLLCGRKYILIDEYQDFSQLFLMAVRAIRSVADTVRLFVVGDDWQAINRFAGSDVEYFQNFREYFKEGFARYEITTNYRCNRMIVEIARKFMKRSMGERGNFRAYSRKNGKVVIVDPRETEVGYALVPYDLRVSARDRILREATERMGSAVVKKSMVQYLKTIIKIIKENLKYDEILILHRNNETNIGGVSLVGFGEGLKWGLDRLGILNYDEFDLRIRLMTMHKSKGLEADVVIIMEADDGVIPKLHPDVVLYKIFGETEEISLSDQKRLFYVAMTRAKKRLYIISKGGGFIEYLGKGVER